MTGGYVYPHAKTQKKKTLERKVKPQTKKREEKLANELKIYRIYRKADHI